MYDYVRSYQTARVYFTIMEVIGWLSAFSGIITLLSGLASIGGRSSETVFGLAQIAGGLLAIFSGLGLIVFIQTSRAVVDNAETSREMLQLMRHDNSQAKMSAQFNSNYKLDANLANIQDLAQRVSSGSRPYPPNTQDPRNSSSQSEVATLGGSRLPDNEDYVLLRNKYGLISKVRIDDDGKAWLLTEQGEELFASLNAIKKHLGI